MTCAAHLRTGFGGRTACTPELWYSIGKQVKAASPATHAYLMGYTNGYIGYFPEQQAYAEGGYEVAVTHLDPASENIYLRALAQLLMRFRQGGHD